MKTEHDEALVERMTDAIERAIDCQMNCSAPRGVTKRIYARAFAIAALETLPARDEAVPASKLGPIPSVESFAINPVGEGDITVEASSRFVHERDMAKVMKWARAAEAALASSTSAESAGGGVQFPPRPSGHVSIAHDGFAGDIIGHYETREGKRGVVVQQDGTRVVHVYGEKWLTETDATRARGQ